MGWKKMLKSVLLVIAKALINAGISWLFKTVGKDGAITKEEAWNYAVEKLESKYGK